MTHKLYTEHSHKVVLAGNRFEHVMALVLNPQNHHEGVIRCIVDRSGDVEIPGYIDRSQLFSVIHRGSHYEIGERLIIKNTEEIVERLATKDHDFVGLEDPDIFYDEDSQMYHLYFTMAFIGAGGVPSHIHTGHAVGTSLDSLEMTMPVLRTTKRYKYASAKEVSLAPVNSKGFRYNLFESSAKIGKEHYSVVRVAKAHDMRDPWHFGDIAFHPGKYNIPWIGGHASPGPLLPETFMDLGPGLRLGVMNGRELNKLVDGQRKYGVFSVGLFIYNYEHGYIEWVSDDYLIRDSEAKTITFASDFVETGPGKGVLYAHVDDSFVRAYTLTATDLAALIPKEFKKKK